LSRRGFRALHRGYALEAVHEPAGVVPVDPVGDQLFHVSQPLQRSAAKR
jgi:hypothetical protein